MAHDPSPMQTRAIAQLRAAGRQAMPGVEHVADIHLAAITRELEQAARGAAAATPPRRTGASRAWFGTNVLPARRALALAALAVFVLPALALAGALPAPIQRAAANAADVVGLEIPAPAQQHATEQATAGRAKAAEHRAEAAEHRARARAQAAAGQQRADARRTGGARPAAADASSKQHGAAPEARERKAEATKAAARSRRAVRGAPGNRYGQVVAGPDQGKAAAAPRRARRTQPPRRPVAATSAPVIDQVTEIPASTTADATLEPAIDARAARRSG